MRPAATEIALAATLNACVLALLGYLAADGTARHLGDDATRIAPVLALVVFAGVALAVVRFAEIIRMGAASGEDAYWVRQQVERRLDGLRVWSEQVTYCAIVGTGIGVMVALAAAAGTTPGDPQALGAMFSGLGTAVLNTVVGCAGAAWISANAHLCAVAARKLELAAGDA